MNTEDPLSFISWLRALCTSKLKLPRTRVRLSSLQHMKILNTILVIRAKGHQISKERWYLPSNRCSTRDLPSFQSPLHVSMCTFKRDSVFSSKHLILLSVEFFRSLALDARGLMALQWVSTTNQRGKLLPCQDLPDHYDSMLTEPNSQPKSPLNSRLSSFPQSDVNLMWLSWWTNWIDKTAKEPTLCRCRLFTSESSSFAQ